MQSLITKATPGVPLMSMLEGGYNLDAIARSAVQCVRAQVDAFSGADEELTQLVSQLEISDTDDGGDGGASEKTDIGTTTTFVSDSGDKPLLDQIYEGFAQCLATGVIRSDPTTMLYRYTYAGLYRLYITNSSYCYLYIMYNQGFEGI